jgi:hypothetical protein
MSKSSYGFRVRFIRIPLMTFLPSLFSFTGKEGKQAFPKTILEKGKEIWVFLILMR